ncbi:hypothetical protein BB558_002937 [Smittium angustum]|uniref:Uncharacterized protein n=1 Tax=Smittium angustum TaxID=133377 RepID=A0A2U1J7F3_SMIAN|nr:hypothetical protein BB558_002937 [Smittium angustum]
MTEFQKLHSLANRIDRFEENIKNLISNAIKDESLPKNATMQYYPSLLNNISILSNQKKVDAQLSDIQYRLSGLTRPLDYFTHKVITDPIQRLTAESVIQFAKTMRVLLADVATTILQLQIKNA